jgi:type I restriction enzyme, S subunit
MANPDYWEGDIPWISAASLTSTRLRSSDRNVTTMAIGRGTRMALTGSTLILVRGMSLHKEIRVGRAMRDLAFNQDVKALQPRDGLDATFLLYALEGRKAELLDLVHSAGHGTGVLATDQLLALPIAVPGLDEQRRIAGVLGALDDLIETNLTVASRADELWRVLVSRVLLCGDESWGVALSNLADFVNGKNFTKGATGTGLPVIRTPEVRSGPDFATPRSDEPAHEDNIAHSGDILFVWSGSLLVGRWLWKDGLVNQHIFKVLPKEGVPDWLVMSAIENLMDDFLGVAADKATTMGHIKRSDLDRMTRVPTPDMWESLDPVVRPLWDQALTSRQEAAALTDVRDQILPMLMSGQVRAQV